MNKGGISVNVTLPEDKNTLKKWGLVLAIVLFGSAVSFVLSIISMLAISFLFGLFTLIPSVTILTCLGKFSKANPDIIENISIRLNENKE